MLRLTCLLSLEDSVIPLLMMNENAVTKPITTIKLVTNGNPNIIYTSDTFFLNKKSLRDFVS